MGWLARWGGWQGGVAGLVRRLAWWDGWAGLVSGLAGGRPGGTAGLIVEGGWIF